MLRQDDFLRMKDMVQKLRKHRQNENGSQSASNSRPK
jgi:hypothetical protein